MPELPEVETTKRGISPHIMGVSIKRVVIRQRQLRWPIDDNLEQILAKQTLKDITRRGKYLILHFDHGALLIHLGMSGSLRIVSQTEPLGKHDHVDLEFKHGAIVRFNDPRRFGAFVWTQEAFEQHALINHLGPEPLSGAFTGPYLFTLSRKRKQAVKSWIMDAKVVVGVGNIYANESLFNAGIHPLKSAGKLSKAQCESLVDEIKQVLSQAITRGGTTLRDFVGGDGKPGYFAQELKVYGKGGQPCECCGKALTEKHIAKRSTVYCTQCQR